MEAGMKRLALVVMAMAAAFAVLAQDGDGGIGVSSLGRPEVLQQRAAVNGPTGWIQADEGRLKLLRIGTLRERHVLEFRWHRDQTVMVPVEDVASIVHSDESRFPIAPHLITLRNGSVFRVNQVDVMRLRTPTETSSYGVNQYGLPVVVEDPASGQPYTRILSNLYGFNRIDFDEPSKWEPKSAAIIPTAFDIGTSALLRQEVAKAQQKAREAAAEAAQLGTLDAFRQGGYSENVRLNLREWLSSRSNGGNCLGDPQNGFWDFRTTVTCRMVAREARLFEAGTRPSPEQMPLSSIFLLAALKSANRY
jgi:hypothetical protein